MRSTDADTRSEFFSDRFEGQRTALAARTAEAIIAVAANDAAERDQSWIACAIIFGVTGVGEIFGASLSKYIGVGEWFAVAVLIAIGQMILTRRGHLVRATARLRRKISRGRKQ